MSVMTIFSVSEYLMGDLQPAVLEETKTKVSIEIVVLFELMLYISGNQIQGSQVQSQPGPILSWRLIMK